MLKYLTSIGAYNEFEKNRLILTAKNMEAPEEHIIKRVLKTFQGEDEETRSQIAFATILKKISTSDSNDSWVYLVKNLIILDRVVADQCFAEEIAELRLPVIEHYVERNSKYLSLRTDAIVRNYWKLIKYTAHLLKNRKHISYFPRSQRSEFLSTLTPAEIMGQMQTLNTYFEFTFDFIHALMPTKDTPDPVAKAMLAQKKTGLVSYLLLQALYKLIAYYSSQMLCMNKIVTAMAKDVNMELLALDDIRRFRVLLTRFKQDSSQIIEFVESNKDIKGFEVVNYRDLDPMPGNTILKSIDQYITERLNRDDEAHSVHTYVSESNIELQVRHKPRISGEDHSFHPRKVIDAHRREIFNNPFENYISSFSEDFPPKEVMTIDLIMAIKQESELETERGTHYDEIISYDEYETCVVNHMNHEEALPEHLHFNKPGLPAQPIGKKLHVYSDLPAAWNFE